MQIHWLQSEDSDEESCISLFLCIFMGAQNLVFADLRCFSSTLRCDFLVKTSDIRFRLVQDEDLLGFHINFQVLEMNDTSFGNIYMLRILCGQNRIDKKFLLDNFPMNCSHMYPNQTPEASIEGSKTHKSHHFILPLFITKSRLFLFLFQQR